MIAYLRSEPAPVDASIRLPLHQILLLLKMFWEWLIYLNGALMVLAIC